MASSLFQAKFHFGRSTILNKLESLLADGGAKFAKSQWMKSSMTTQARKLGVDIRKMAPVSQGKYLRRNIAATAAYSSAAPHWVIKVVPRSMAARYWIQREANVNLGAVGGSKYRRRIYSRRASWLYVPPVASPVWRLTQGFDKRSATSTAKSLARRAGYPVTAFIYGGSNTGYVLGWRSKAQKNAERSGGENKNSVLLYYARKSVRGGSEWQRGRYIGPAIENRQEAIGRSVMWAWTRYLAELRKGGGGGKR